MISYPPGTPCWVDVFTTDPDGAKSFYASLFGWDVTQEGPPGEEVPYWIFTKDGLEVAGLTPSQTEPPRSFWNTYIAVADADDAHARLVASDAETILEATTMLDQGRMGMYRDGADGAVFATWQPMAFKGAQHVNAVGAWAMSELDTRDVDGAARFYGDMFGWKLTPIEVGGNMVYGSLTLDGRLIAGLLPMGPQFPPEVPANWLTYFGVDDVDATQARVEELGGRTLAPPMDVPTGRFVVLQDPQGAAFAVLQGDYDPPPGT